MSKNISALRLAKELIRSKGERKARALLAPLVASGEAGTLTIVANKSLHTIPERYLRGRVYIASRGTLDLSSPNTAVMAYRRILARLVKVLRSQSWDRIYLIPTGHPTLSGAIKLAVYQATRQNTIDLFYANGLYFDLDISIRELK